MQAFDRNVIIAGFPGVGKSHAENIRKDVIDLESSRFHYVENAEKREMEESPSWPRNYLDEIETLYSESYRKIILVSTHRDVIEGLVFRGLPFLVVAPDRTQKNEYLVRYLRRGSSVYFIRSMWGNWDNYIDSIKQGVFRNPNNSGYYPTVIWLSSGEYLTDVLPQV